MGCTMCIHISMDRISRKYVVRTLITDHNHTTGPHEFESYATTRRPIEAELLVSHRANPCLVKQYLHHSHGAKVTAQDVYNIRQKCHFEVILF